MLRRSSQALGALSKLEHVKEELDTLRDDLHEPDDGSSAALSFIQAGRRPGAPQNNFLRAEGGAWQTLEGQKSV